MNSNIIITNIKELVGILPKNKLVLSGKNMNELSILKNAFIKVKEDKIQSFGLMKDLKLKDSQNVYNANGDEIYYEDSDDYWEKREYNSNGDILYYENSMC